MRSADASDTLTVFGRLVRVEKRKDERRGGREGKKRTECVYIVWFCSLIGIFRTSILRSVLDDVVGDMEFIFRSSKAE